MQLGLSTYEIIIRLLLATLISGLIGFDREQKNHPAGIRTHILVCVGACIIALIQQNIGFQALNFAREYPQFSGVIRSDEARLIAQVVSGIGFLGAGTIMVTRHAITGLTTAASLWATAGLGIALGMGYYQIAIIGSVVVFLVLVLLKKIIKVHTIKRIEIKFLDKKAARLFLTDYFKTHQISVSSVAFKTDQTNHGPVYTSIYSIEAPKDIAYHNIVTDIFMNENIQQVRLVAV